MKYVDQSTLYDPECKRFKCTWKLSLSCRGNISLSEKVRCPADFEPIHTYLEVEEEVLWALESFLVMSENREGHVLSTSTTAAKNPNHQTLSYEYELKKNYRKSLS